MRVGIVLSGGGLRGAAHLGVLRRIVRHHIPVPVMVGVSAGAIIAAYYAAVGLSVHEMIEQAPEFRGRHLVMHGLTLRAHPALKPYLRRFCGIIPQRLAQLELATFERLHHGVERLGIVCHDLCSNQPRYFSTADHQGLALADIARASAAVPGMFPPKTMTIGRDTARLIDGGVSDSLPTGFARSPAMGATHPDRLRLPVHGDRGARRQRLGDLHPAGSRRHSPAASAADGADEGGLARRSRGHVGCDRAAAELVRPTSVPERRMMPIAPTIFLDFDGTITVRDATDAILEAFADRRWLDVEEAWKSGRIGSRECLTLQLALVEADRRDVDALLDGIEVDAGFVTLVEWGVASGAPVHIVSDGFDYCIARILARPSLGFARYAHDIRVVSSHLEPDGRRWRASFTSSGGRCAHGCATCKPAAIEQLGVAGSPNVFVGDGLSDRYAAAAADMVFAKDTLAGYCLEQSIPHTPFTNLATVARRLDEIFASEILTERTFRGKALPSV